MTEAKQQVERVERLSMERFERDFLGPGRPIVISNGLSASPALASWTPQGLIERIGGTIVNVALSDDGHFGCDPQAGTTFAVERMPFRAAAARILDPAKIAPRPYVMQIAIQGQLPEIEPDVRPPELLGDEPCAPYLWFGGAGNVTPLHYDATNNFYAQVRGRKRFTLFDAGHFDELYPFPVTARFSHISHIDVERPDLDRFPKFGGARPLECELCPGDLLFLPAFYWHHVRSLDVAISVSFWWAPQFEQCFAPAILRVFRALYVKDRLASIGAPIAGFSGGFIGAARQARTLGHASAAALFAGAALESGLRALAGQPRSREGRGVTLPPLEAIRRTFVDALVYSREDDARVAGWERWAAGAVQGSDELFSGQESARMIDEIGAFLEALAARALSA